MTSGLDSTATWLGASEMGRRIAEFNWTNHPLGPSENWSHSLKTTIQIMLNSRYAMWMGWGSELYFFCNDAYLPTVGIKQSWVLGTPARKVWTEIWSDVGPRAQSVVQTGKPTWDESLLLILERSGFPEETYHTFSYSPIPDDSGNIGGMLCVVTEETERVIGERRLAVLRELGVDLTGINNEQRLMEAIPRRFNDYEKDLPFSLMYLLEADGRHARLSCSHGIGAANSLALPTIDVENDQCIWPARRVIAENTSILVEDLAERIPRLPTGPWPTPPQQAVVVPIARQGHERPAGFLVAGISSYRRFDDDYLGFIQLLAGQIGAGLSSARAYDEERQRAEMLAELDRAKTTFFSNVSHEFRTPLTLMLGPLEDALADGPGSLTAAQEERLEIAHRNGLRLLKLVNTLLDFSRIEASRMRAVYEAVDLSQFTADLASNFRSACERAGIKLVLNCLPLSGPANVDRDMWEKIVLNLLSNAFKFTFAGEIEVGLAQVNGNAVLTVRDTGLGIPEHALPHLFERFYRVEGMDGRTHEGSGIGLALVQELVRLHDGEITVSSQIGQGSMFSVSIPLGSARSQSGHLTQPRGQSSSRIGALPFVEEALRWLPKETGAQGSALGTESAGVVNNGALGEIATSSPAFASERVPRPRVLVADDNSDMRDYMTRLLGDDFTIEAVGDGEAALVAVHRCRPDLILSDVMMPKLDGLELLRRLRVDPETRSLPIVLLSARAGETARVEGLAAGADGYLIKPFSAAELKARVAGTLTLAAMRREADLTLRHNAEERQKFVSLVESSRDFIAMAALNGDVFYVNPAGRALLGLDGAEDVELASIRDYFPVAMQQMFESTVLPTALKKGQWQGEFQFQHRHNGKLLLTHQTFFLIRSPDDEAPLCLAIVARDISAQKQAEAELRVSEQRYRELVHGLPAAVYTCDTQGRITLFNDAAVELWGRAPEIGKDSWCGSVRIYRLDGTVLPLDQCPMAMALKHGRAVKGEEIIIERADGTRRHVLPHPQPLFDAYGTVIGAINMLVDITERKATEDALRASEERLRLATEAGTLGVWDWDIAHNRVTWTESLYPIHGLEPGEFGGTVESFSQLVHPDDRPRVSQAIAAAVKDEALFELEFRILRPNGEVVWIFTNAKVLRENGRAVRMVGATVDISERKRAEYALRESEARISQLIALMPAAIYTCDADGHITFFNRRAAELWGREPRAGAAGELFTGTYRLWRPDGTLVARDQTPMAEAVRSGQSARGAELIIERPDGTHIDVSANIEPLHDRYGRNSGAISVFQDISERKNAERELQDRNEAIQLLSETLEQLLRANDAETIVRNVFDKVAAHVGADSYFNFMVNGLGGPLELQSCFGVPDEIVEKISRLDSGQAICGTAAEAHQAIAANNIQHSDDEKLAFARSIGLQSYNCNPLMVGDNLFGTLAFASHTQRFFDVDHLEFLRIVSQYTAIALDRLRNAKALRSSEDQLAEELTSMQQLHAMTTRLIAARDISAALNEILDAVIAIQGADFGKVRVYNPALKGLEIVAQRGFEQSFIDRFRVVTVEDDSASGIAIRTKSRVVVEDVETDADYSPGRSIAAIAGYRAVQATPLISRSGDILGMLLTHFRRPRRPTARELRFVDLYARQAADFIELLHTKQELHESEERLRRQANELEQQLIASGRLVSLGEITASMAHEFNNPLGIVLGFVEDLLNSTPPDDPIHRPLQIIDDEAQRCKRIIQDLMDYTRPHATHLSQTKIPDLISKTLKLIENRLYKQKIKLTTEIADDLPRVHADYQQLEQVMVNLYLNAIDAMPQGGELAVSAKARGSNGKRSVAIAVTDTGFGIDKETLARIFQPFYTAKKTRGLGLGLPICERIVKNHGGRIDVESQVGQGTTFKVIIPLTQETA